jgi:hypothetical protein
VIKELKALWKLQTLDIEISELEAQKKEIPKEIASFHKKLKAKEEELQKKKKKYEEISAQRRKLEQDIEITRDTVRKHRAQLLLVKTNKEYQALLYEINTEETKISAYEDESLELLTKSEEIAKEIAKMSKELEKKRKEFEEYKKNKQTELAKVTNLLDTKRAFRKEVSNKISRAFLARYEQVMKSRGGVGVVEIIEATCTGCNAIIPPQFVAEIKKGARILTCEQCGRILVWRENVE